MPLKPTCIYSLLFAVVFFITGCSNTANLHSADVSTHRLNSPEVKSAGTFKLELGLATRDEVDYGANPKVEGSTDPYIKGGVGVGSGLEFDIGTSTSAEGLTLGAKFQFLGETSDKAKQWNFSQAIRLEYEYYHKGKASDDNDYDNGYDESDDTDNDLSDLTYDIFDSIYESVYEGYPFEKSVHYLDISWIFGLRPLDSWLIYGGPFYKKGFTEFYDVPAEFEESRLEKNGDMKGINIASEHQLFDETFVAVEVVFYEYDWHNNHSDDAAVNLKIEWVFK